MTFRPINIEGRALLAPAPQAAPSLSWIPIENLVIDDDYQRPLGSRNWQAIERIARGFSWAKFAPVLVSPVAGGKFAVIDGQHRCHAAALCGFDSVPACAVPIAPAQQAEAFAAVNVAVTRMTVQNVFKARLAAGDPLARRCDDIVTAAGCRLMTYVTSSAIRKPGEMLCVGTIERLVKNGRAAELAAVLDGLLRSKEGAASSAPWTEAIIWPAVMAAYDARLTGRDLCSFFDAHPPLKAKAASDRVRLSGDFGKESAQSFLRRSLATLMRAWAGKAARS